MEVQEHDPEQVTLDKTREVLKALNALSDEVMLPFQPIEDAIEVLSKCPELAASITEAISDERIAEIKAMVPSDEQPRRWGMKEMAFWWMWYEIHVISGEDPDVVKPEDYPVLSCGNCGNVWKSTTEDGSEPCPNCDH